jgi:hypothetical protein
MDGAGRIPERAYGRRSSTWTAFCSIRASDSDAWLPRRRRGPPPSEQDYLRAAGVNHAERVQSCVALGGEHFD